MEQRQPETTAGALRGPQAMPGTGTVAGNGHDMLLPASWPYGAARQVAQGTTVD